ncbi:MAG: hypothetical protein QF659_02940 [Dehalococcoidia bacterium]|nr:hypothetical protein [Dehalococcoidia bacterium]
MDEDEWRCWQCGRYYYPLPPPTVLRPVPHEPVRVLVPAGRAAPVRFSRNKRAARDINSVISAKVRGENLWWSRNRETIRLLDEGKSVQEIAALLERGPRQIRIVRERLNDLRTIGECDQSAD